MRGTSLTLIALMVAGSSARAEECGPTETLYDCMTRVTDAQIEATESTHDATPALALGRAEEALAALPTSSDTGGQNTAGVKEDFNSRLALLALVAGDPSEDTDGNLVFDLNFLVAGTGLGRNAKLQAIVNPSPKVGDAVAGQLPEDGRDDLVSKLEKTLDDTDDITFTAAYSLQGERWGRSFEQYQQAFSGIVKDALATVGRRAPVAPLIPVIDGLRACWASKVVELQSAQTELDTGDDKDGRRPERESRLQSLRDVLASYPEEPELKSATYEMFGRLCDAATSRKLRDGVERTLAAVGADMTLTQNALAEHGASLFAKLVDNQPQFFLSLRQHERGGLVGANETAFEASFEFSQTNLNTAFGRCRPSPAETCFDEYTKFTQSSTNQTAINAGNRFSAKLQYSRREALDVDLSAEGIAPFSLAGGHSFMFTLGWSRRLAVAAETEPETEPMLIELDASYENVSDDPLRRDRGVATLTVTRKLANGISLPIGLTYANHSKYLGQQDAQLSAHLGLRFTAH
jgi:hypothetical protein